MDCYATKDIATYAARRWCARDFVGKSTQELLGPCDVVMKEVSSIVGRAIGKPSLGYMQVPFTMLELAMAQAGMPKKTAALLVEMMKPQNDGMLDPQEPRSAKNTTPTTIETYVSEVFVPAYSSKAAGV